MNGVQNDGFDGSNDTVVSTNGAAKHDGDRKPSSAEPDAVEEQEEIRCGYGACKPEAVQCCNNPKIVLFWLCMCAFIQGFVVNGINNVNTTTVEKRFGLAASQVGLISSSYDIAAALTVLPMTYYATFAHQPRMLSIAALSIAAGSFIMSLPHFITDTYQYGNSLGDECILEASNSTSIDSSSSSTSLSNYIYVLILGQLFNGYGGSCLYTVGVVYIDSNVKTKDSPFYQGIMICFSALGAAVGYLAGGFFLDLWIDIDEISLSTISIEPTDPRWLGAWWAGFVVAGSLMLIVVFGIFPFPKLTPAGIKNQASRQSQAHNDGSEDIVSDDSFLRSWRDAPTALKILLKNPVFMFCTLANTSDSLVISGYATFLPKIIQNQFGQTAGWAALLAGFVAVPGTILGNILGGGLTKCLKLKVRGMLRFCMLVSVLTAFGIFIALAKCDLPNFAGVSVPYSESGIVLSEVNLTSPCNAECGCTQSNYQPVCGSDGIQYFSPCYAGCKSVNDTASTKVYSDCSCLSNASLTVLDEPCAPPDCDALTIFLPIFAIVIVFIFMVGIPTINVTLRCVPDKQRSFGMGVNAVMWRFLGTIPGPLLFGYIFDSACIVWQTDDNGADEGSCWIYDNAKLSQTLLALTIVLKIVSTIFFGIADCTYKPPPEDEPSMEGLDNPIGLTDDAVEVKTHGDSKPVSTHM